MIYSDLAQLVLSQRERVNTRIDRAVTAITVGPVTDEKILYFDLVNYTLPIIDGKVLLSRTFFANITCSEWLQGVHGQKLLIVEALLHGLAILCRVEPRVGQDLRDRDPIFRIDD